MRDPFVLRAKLVLTALGLFCLLRPIDILADDDRLDRALDRLNNRQVKNFGPSYLVDSKANEANLKRSKNEVALKSSAEDFQSMAGTVGSKAPKMDNSGRSSSEAMDNSEVLSDGSGKDIPDQTRNVPEGNQATEGNKTNDHEVNADDGNSQTAVKELNTADKEHTGIKAIAEKSGQRAEIVRQPEPRAEKHEVSSRPGSENAPPLFNNGTPEKIKMIQSAGPEANSLDEDPKQSGRASSQGSDKKDR